MLERWDAGGAGGGWLTGPEGTHRNELIIPLVARPAGAARDEPGPVRTARTRRPAPRRTRSAEHPPGGEWLYATVHCTPARQNELLVHHLDDLLDGLPEDVDRWFFIRYRSPDDLLRLRFHGAPDTLTATLLPRLHRWAATLRSAALIRGIGLCTYDPELERYGGPRAMAAAERVFHADSLAAVEALRLRETGRLTLDPVTVAALGQAHIARTFWTAYTAHEAKSAQPAWLGRVLDAVPRGEMHHAFQKRRREVLPLVDVHGDWPGLRGRPGGEELLASWQARTAAVTAYARTLRTLGDDAWSAPVPVFLSLLHMHHNRVIGIGPQAEQAATAVMRGAVQAHRDRIRSCS